MSNTHNDGKRFPWAARQKTKVHRAYRAYIRQLIAKGEYDKVHDPQWSGCLCCCGLRFTVH